MKTTSPAVAITAAIPLFPSAVSSHADPKNGKTAIEYDGGGRPTKASMETGFFVSVAAFGFEVLVFVATIVAAVAKALRGKTMWWSAGIASLAAATALLFSGRYVFTTQADQSWVILGALSVLMPLILFCMSMSTSRRNRACPAK
jgi:hypothetical protein